MGLFDALENRSSDSLVTQWPPGPGDDYWYRPAPTGTQSGIEVTPQSSLQLTAVWRAVNLLSSAVGTLPCKLYKRRSGEAGGRDVQRDDPLFWLLRWQPNPWQPAVDFFEMMQGHVLLRGNAFAQIKRTPLGEPTSLMPWHPDRTKIEVLESGRLVYKLRRALKPDLVVPQEDMLHVRGPGGNGIIGYSVVAMMAEALGMTFAAQAYGARFFDNNASPSGVLSHPGKLSKAARQNIETSWKLGYGGRRQHSMALVEEGMSWTQVGVAPEEAQFLETRKFQVAEIARAFGVPPHMLMEMDRATFSNIEHQGLEFATYSVRPWLIRWEQTIKMVLLDGRREHTVEFLMDAILRGDAVARAESNQVRFQNGTLSIDEWRAGENQNPLPDGQGQTHFVMLNMVPVEQANEGLPDTGVDVPPDDDEDDEENALVLSMERRYLAGQGCKGVVALNALQVRSVGGRHRQLRAFQRLLHKSAAKVVRREVRDVKRALNATDADETMFMERLSVYYEEFKAVVAREMNAVLQEYSKVIYALAAKEVGFETEMPQRAKEFVRQYSDNMAKRHVLSSEQQLGAVVREATVGVSLTEGVGTALVRGAVLERLEGWEETRAAKMAAREAVQANGAVSVNAYSEAGVQEIVWVTVGENCPLCDALDGRTVSIGSNFVDKGGTVEGEGSAPLTARRGIAHPPLHPPNCNCMVAAK